MRQVPFKAQKFNKNTYVIEGVVCYSYLVLGETEALLIDTGMPQENLRTFVEQLTDLPVKVVNTHGHVDHILGNPYFDKVYMHPKAKEDAKEYYIQLKEKFGENGNFHIETVTEGYVFELGGRQLKVLECACHSPGDIALLDKENRILFTGDNLESGQVLLFYGDAKTGASVAGHLEIMKKFNKYSDEFDIICPAHNGTPLDKIYLQWMIENDEKILSGEEGTAEIYSPSFNESFPINVDREFVRCSEHKGTAVVYDKRRVNKSERLYANA